MQTASNSMEITVKADIRKQKSFILEKSGIYKAKIRRGDVYLADLSTGEGCEQQGVRPVLVIQNDIGNTHSPTVIVVAITSQLTKAKLPTHVGAGRKQGLDRPSVVLCEQVRTIDKLRLIKKITKFDDYMMSKVDRAIQVSFGLIQF